MEESEDNQQLQQVQNELQNNQFNIESSARWKSALKLQKGNPARLLKSINPNEAQLLEAASNVHLRFRLGGQNFPPNIYYKIYLNGGGVDINSFAPRDYSLIQRPENPHSHKKITYDQYRLNKNVQNQEGWYLRVDNNGWRPISHKVLNKTDFVELYSTNKFKYYHFKKQKRDEKAVRKKRVNKLRWLQNMYKNARQEEEQDEKDKIQQENKQQQDQYQEYDEDYEQEMRDYMEIPKDYNPLKDDKFIDLDEEEFDNEVKELIEWSDNLDYDNYARDWFQLSTSNASNNFISQPVNQNVTLSSTQVQNNINTYQKNNKTQQNILQQAGSNILSNSNTLDNNTQQIQQQI